MQGVQSNLAVQDQPLHDDAAPIVNDFSIQIATVNGSGSQSANNVLLRSIFRMGVPVSGKNLFPSNIAGLPTWYTIRVSKFGWVARNNHIDILIAMNAETAREDILSLRPGAAAIYEADRSARASASGLERRFKFQPIPKGDSIDRVLGLEP